jgi:parvulin-like peptidyl-prolyl isomerase
MAIRTVGRGRAFTAFGLMAAAAGGFWLGRGGPQSRAVAAPPTPPPAQAPQSDYGVRVVAYIYGSVPITREDLGEYLIARMKQEKVENLVNRRIIDVACQKRGIEVTEAEVEAALIRDLEPIKLSKADFVQKILKQRGTTLYEYKEDVLKPALMLTKICQPQIKVTDDEVRLAFNAAYGEKRDCRIILWPKDEERVALKEYEDIRKSEEGFDRKARTQATAGLAATGGRIKPIAHNAGIHEEVEKAAFSLQPGEISALINTKEGIAVLKMDKVIPPDTSVKFEDKREALYKEVFDRRLQAELPKMFMTLREEAKPVFILKKPTSDPDAIKRDAEELLQQTGGTVPPKP